MMSGSLRRTVPADHKCPKCALFSRFRTFRSRIRAYVSIIPAERLRGTEREKCLANLISSSMNISLERILISRSAIPLIHFCLPFDAQKFGRFVPSLLRRRNALACIRLTPKPTKQCYCVFRSTIFPLRSRICAQRIDSPARAFERTEAPDAQYRFHCQKMFINGQ